MKIKWLIPLTLLTSSVIAGDIRNIITVELAERALESNLLTVYPLKIEACADFDVIEHHQQTSVMDKHVSTIDVTAKACEEDYSITYEYYFLQRLPNNHYCSFDLKIIATGEEIPQAQLSGDCGFNVKALKLRDEGEYHYTIS